MSNRRKLRGEPPMPPHVRALADQAEMADTEHRALMGGAIEAGGYGRKDTTGRITWELAGVLAGHIRDMTLKVCAHLAPASPAPAYWMPWKPDAVVCQRCMLAEQLEIIGAAEDVRCDGCKTLHPDDLLTPVMVQFPAAVAEMRDGTARHRPPILMMAGLCDQCWKADREPFTPPEPERQPGMARSWFLQHQDGPVPG